MKTFVRQLNCTSFFLLFSFALAAQTPTLKVSDPDGKEDISAVSLQSLNIDVQIYGNIATTTITMNFYNKGIRILEGNLTFPLPENTTVSRYGIDINGKLREAVPVEKTKGTEVFENIEHRRIDPGLLEKVDGNNFRTRIYPINPGSIRTVMIAYEEELKTGSDRNLKYYLPLNYASAIASFHLKTTVYNSALKPTLEAQPDGSFSFSNTGNIYTAEMNRINYLPTGKLIVNLPKNTDMPEVILQPAEESFYFLANVYPELQSRPRKWSEHIGLIWDVSLSALHRDIKKELELLGKIIQQKPQCTISLGLLNNTFKKDSDYVITNGNWQALRSRLEKIIYDGGTDYSAINKNIFPAGEYIFVTDGLSTFGKDTVALDKNVHCITSAASADFSKLKFISYQSGGQFVNLTNTSVDDAVKILAKENMQFIGIKENADISETYPAMHVPVTGTFSIAGIAAKNDTWVTLQFGFGNEVKFEKKILLKYDSSKISGINVSRVWAQKKIAEMDIDFEKNKSDISALGKEFGIVTRNTSLIVLENVEDYVRYEIEPPSELRAEYDQLMKDRSVGKEERLNDLLEQAFSMTETLHDWWSQTFSKRKKYPKTTFSADLVSIGTNQVMLTPPKIVSDVQLQPSYYTVEMNKTSSDGLTSNGSTMNYTTSTSISMWNEKSTSAPNDDERKVAIDVAEFRSDKAYMKKFTNATTANAYKEYLLQRKKYETTPLFYYDIANWFYLHKSNDTALMILSNINELDVENAELYKLLAYRLKQTGNYKSEIFITGKVMQWRPMDPQSFRDHALALADDGDYQAALDTLYSIFTRSYPEASTSRDDGIEEIIVTEINNLISRHGDKLDVTKIDKKIVASMPVDVRVVINWNKNDTDIDLWVTDPNGEKCFYSNPLTAIGGRISNDFTQGFGPEQFMLKKAIHGKYKIQVNYFGDTQVSITGPTTVMAEIYTRYSDNSEQRKILTLQMPKENKGGVFIGSFVF